MGRLKGSTKMTEQAYRYAKSVWTATAARAHCKRHKGTYHASAGLPAIYRYILGGEEDEK